MPESLWLLIFGVLVVIAVALFRRFAVPVVGLGALFVTIIACLIFAGIEIYVVGAASVFGFVFAALIIYAVSNLIFQLIVKMGIYE